MPSLNPCTRSIRKKPQLLLLRLAQRFSGIDFTATRVKDFKQAKNAIAKMNS